MSRQSMPAGRSAPECQVVFVTGPSSPPFTPQRRADVELRLIETKANEAIETVRRVHRAALVWVDDSAGSDSPSLVAAIKTFEPGLPMVWSGRGAAPANFPKPAPDRLVLGRTAWDTGADHVADLVHATTYHTAIVDDLCNASREALAAGFGIRASVAETFFKGSRSPLASVSAAVELSGNGVEASVIVSAEAKPLRDMLRVTVPGAIASLTALHDLTGEIANHIVGRLKLALDPDGAIFNRQNPLVLRGHEANIRAIRGRPSVALRMIAGDVELFVQLYLKGVLPVRAARENGSTKPGELTFLKDVE